MSINSTQVLSIGFEKYFILKLQNNPEVFFKGNFQELTLSSWINSKLM